VIGRAVDLELASAGYLKSVDGRLNWVRDLDVLARDTVAVGVSVLWVMRATSHTGWYCYDTRTIWLAPWLFYAPAPLVKDVWSHELAHVVVGPEDEAARRWQYRVYRDVVLPAWLAA
jgi:hypothetical protein